MADQLCCAQPVGHDLLGEREGTWHIPEYKVMPLQRQIDRPSFGNFGRLPTELLWMVFRHLTCDDLEALHSCSTGGRIAILAFPQYHRLLNHAPTILAILKETLLAQSFTVTETYETFTSTLCTTCCKFGACVFVTSLTRFTRYCIRCAETELKFMQISRDGAKKEFGVKGKRIMDSLTPLSSLEGYHSSFDREVKYYTHLSILVSREMIE